MKIGILICGTPADEIRQNYGTYFDFFVRLLSGRGLDFVPYNVEAMEFPNSVTECDGWLLTGSKHGAYEDHAFIPPLEDFIRKAHAAGVPMVGICFGHQIIAQALGGEVSKHPGGWSVGRVDYKTTDGKNVALNAWHQDQVMRPPEGAVTTMSTDFCPYAALTYPGGIWTVQPHPELDNTLIREFLRIRGKPAGVPDPLLKAALDEPPAPLDDAAIADQIARHFKAHAKVTHV